MLPGLVRVYATFNCRPFAMSEVEVIQVIVGTLGLDPRAPTYIKLEEVPPFE